MTSIPPFYTPKIFVVSMTKCYSKSRIFEVRFLRCIDISISKYQKEAAAFYSNATAPFAVENQIVFWKLDHENQVFFLLYPVFASREVSILAHV